MTKKSLYFYARFIRTAVPFELARCNAWVDVARKFIAPYAVLMFYYNHCSLFMKGNARQNIITRYSVQMDLNNGVFSFLLPVAVCCVYCFVVAVSLYRFCNNLMH